MALTEFNLTLGQNITGIIELMQGVNITLMNSMFGLLLMITIGVILFISFNTITNSFGKSILATSFLLLPIALMLRGISLINDVMLFSTLVVLAICIAVFNMRD